jgi:uncharacterized protein (DUF302 family)
MKRIGYNDSAIGEELRIMETSKTGEELIIQMTEISHEIKRSMAEQAKLLEELAEIGKEIIKRMG